MQRLKPAKQRIEQALREKIKKTPLIKISVSELCRAAHVSRSTFYTYFSNVGDVYEACIRELVVLTSPIKAQLKCSDCEEGIAGMPLCRVIRESDEYRGIGRDDRFLSTFLSICNKEFHMSSAGVYDDVCSQKEIANALQCFQLAGCIMTAKGIPESQDWTSTKVALDTFIKGGLDAVREKGF